MVVSVEISGVLERRLRKLVELGLYGSVSEVVRDALRRYFESLDLKRVALDLYLSREVSLGYAADVAGVSYDEFLDNLVYRGVQPLLGVLDSGEVAAVGGELLLDPSSVYVIYKSRLVDLIASAGGHDVKMLAPRQLAPRIQALNALRVRVGLPAVLVSGYVDLEVDESEDFGAVTPLEKACIDYAARERLPLISDDLRVRAEARRRGARAHSSLSILETLIEKGSLSDARILRETILSLKAVPVLVPAELEERWLARK
ncbi:MAG: UPF0175 family protein [Acidilobaceae archaeon]